MTPIAQEIISMIENTDMTHWTDAHDKAVIAALRAQPDHRQLVKSLRLGASISRERSINLDFAKIADEAADALEGI